MSNLRMFWRSLRAHQGLRLCWALPVIGAMSGALGHANDHRLERGLVAAGLLALLTWIPVLWTAYTRRHQYKEPSDAISA